MIDLIEIRNSQFSEEFESLDLEFTFLLDRKFAKEIWIKYIDKDFKPYHQLENRHWLYSEKSIEIGNWLVPYNDDDYCSLEKLFDLKVHWNSNDLLFFVMSRYFIIRTTWCEFKKYSINFLMCEDESPILINQNDMQKVVVFNPIGSIKTIIRKER